MSHASYCCSTALRIMYRKPAAPASPAGATALHRWCKTHCTSGRTDSAPRRAAECPPFTSFGGIATMQRETLSVGQLARRWSVDRARVHALIRAGKLKAFTIPSAGRFGKTVRILLVNVESVENGESPPDSRRKQTRAGDWSETFPRFSRLQNASESP